MDEASALKEVHPTREFFEQNGYAVVPELFIPEELSIFKRHFENLRLLDKGSDRSFAGDALDPLKVYPRLMQPHRYDSLSLQWLTDPRLKRWMVELTGEEPFAVQTMFYFKPPGARGQALHQDNFYLKADPSTCLAAWLAIDDCDEENGCLQVVPASHTLPTLCLSPADTTQSFTDVEVEVPKDMQVLPVRMKAGDVLFFNGQLIHGSGPNRSSQRFRRALIGHYALGDCTAVSKFYHPVFNMNGEQVRFGVNEGGSECGEFVEIGGKRSVAMRPGSAKDRQLLTE